MNARLATKGMKADASRVLVALTVAGTLLADQVGHRWGTPSEGERDLVALAEAAIEEGGVKGRIVAPILLHTSHVVSGARRLTGGSVAERSDMVLAMAESAASATDPELEALSRQLASLHRRMADLEDGRALVYAATTREEIAEYASSLWIRGLPEDLEQARSHVTSSLIDMRSEIAMSIAEVEAARNERIEELKRQPELRPDDDTELRVSRGL